MHQHTQINLWLHLMSRPRTASPVEVAQFIERMTGELRLLAAHNDLDLLAYLLAVAHAEALDRSQLATGHSMETRPPG